MNWLVVDAMNVIGSRPDGWWHDREGAVADLVAAVRRAAPRLADEITIVVDGMGDHEPADDTGVEVLRAGRGPDAADDAILAIVAAAGAPATVVTADRNLRDRLGSLPIDIQIEGPATFRQRLEAASAEAPPTA